MKHTVVFDCEFLTAGGAPSRFWCGPYDPDPVVAQIGAVKLGLEPDFPLIETLRLYVVPHDRHGKRVALEPFFTKLTGIAEDHVEREGLRLGDALGQVSGFASGARLWSWGKDEFNMVAISCYVEDVPPPIPAAQFGNACHLLLKAGMPYEDLEKTRSDRLADHFGIAHPPLRGHDALDDALSVAYVLRSFLRSGTLQSFDFE
ncbi:exonuclease [Oceaniovalibus guishaninsula JLT2003]|uniref:Exonuclease n=1 Tax=Oceaniovalibus guishaninsula JLT2003 TaxID=1231392 RepID=K2HQY1_9RHOB|nr:hypothetical protein [Oceaniovalibus guishaninsula]EKE45134.1 exonuclease [Oceaniovalibus guishaninsula JLT2003]